MDQHWQKAGLLVALVMAILATSTAQIRTPAAEADLITTLPDAPDVDFNRARNTRTQMRILCACFTNFPCRETLRIDLTLLLRYASVCSDPHAHTAP